LNDVYVGSADVFFDLYVRFATRERNDVCTTQLRTEVGTNFFGEFSVGVTGENLEVVTHGRSLLWRGK
jgi:hypothetical protein